MRTLTAFVLLVLGTLSASGAGPVVASETGKRIAIQVDENDPGRMNLALNNTEALFAYYEAKGVPVEVRIVAYGPGLHMLRSDTSPVKDRISAMRLKHDSITFAACGNTRAAMTKNEDKPIPLIEEAHEVPSGVVELVELQEAGWAYIRP